MTQYYPGLSRREWNLFQMDSKKIQPAEKFNRGVNYK